MSAHYDLIPLAHLCAVAKNQAWLKNMGLLIPDQWEASRDPTAEEARSVVRQLVDENCLSDEADFRVAGDDLDATLKDSLCDTLMSVENYTEDHSEDTPRRISFQYGSPELVLMICERLSHTCGLCLLTLDGAFFVLVIPGVSPEAPWVADDF